MLPPPPKAPSVTPDPTGVSSVDVQWSYTPPDGTAVGTFSVTSSPPVGSCTVGPEARSCSIAITCAAGTTWGFSVRAVNLAGPGRPSAAGSFAVPIPGTPGTPKGTPRPGAVWLEWEAAPSFCPVQSYTVTYIVNGDTKHQTFPTNSGLVSGLTVGAQFSVHATSVAGDGPESAKSAPVSPASGCSVNCGTHGACGADSASCICDTLYGGADCTSWSTMGYFAFLAGPIGAALGIVGGLYKAWAWCRAQRKKDAEREALLANVCDDRNVPSADQEPNDEPDDEVAGRGRDVPEVSFEKLHAATGGFSSAQQVGEGGSGPVFRAELGGRAVAVKVLKANELHADSAQRAFATELRLMATLSHPGVVRLLGQSTDGLHPCLVYELMPGGSMDQHLAGGTERTQ